MKLDTIVDVDFLGQSLTTTELDIVEEDYFKLHFIDTLGNIFSKKRLYLEPKDNISVVIDSLDVKFKGDHANRNNWISKSFYEFNDFGWYDKWAPYYGKIDEPIFYRDSIYQKKIREINEFAENPEFCQKTIKEFDLLYITHLLNQGANNLISSFEKEHDSNFLNAMDRELLNSSTTYVNLLAAKVRGDALFSEKKLTDILQKIESKALKKCFLTSLLKPFTYWGLKGIDIIHGPVIKKFFEENNQYNTLKILSNPNLVQRMEFYEKWDNVIGEKVNFSYEDINGKKVDLDDFKGKYVYIDFWATWCGKCIQLFPDFYKLKERFKNENIEFISISLDFQEKIQDWKKMVQKKNLKGIQLIAPQSKSLSNKNGMGFDNEGNKDSFIRLLNVNSYFMGIPHFTLISPEGCILKAAFRRPDDPEIDNALSAYLNDKK